MDIKIGTFNLNNLFGRWNLYVEVPETRALPTAEESAAIEPPRDWLEEAAPLAATRVPEARDAEPPDVKIVLEGDLVAGRIKWRTNPASGKVVFRKSAEARQVLAQRIKAIDADVLALQEVESIEALEEFVDEERLDDYRHLVLVEGNDERLIDVALMSKLPIGAVTSWRHRTYKNRPRERPIFSRDLLEAEILDERRKRVLFTVFNNHLKSKLATNEEERRAGDRRR